MNPRRYGATTWHDHARHRLSVFAREEARAIVAYLEFKRNIDDDELDGERIEAALRLFWSERARTAPTASALARHLADQEEYFAAIHPRPDQGTGES